MSLNDETKDLVGAQISEDELNAVAGGAGPDANGNYICPYCREYALKPGEDGKYHCSYCGGSFDNHF